MAVFNEPTLWTHALGNNADVSTLPDDTSGTTGLASLQKLFQLINQTPLEAGGIAPSREDFNALFKFLGDPVFYMMNGGLWTYSTAMDYPVGALVKYNNAIYECVQANGPSSTLADPTDAAYWSQIPTMADLGEVSFQTSDIKIATSSTIQNGWLLCNGAAISRTTYANLFDKIGTTYGSGDGSTTFNIPDLRDRYIIGAGTNALGAYISEQLPNIVGTYGTRGYIRSPLAVAVELNPLDSGALYNDYAPTGTCANVASSGDSQRGIIGFNANLSNSIYTNSGKVYPASIALNFIIKT